MLGMTESVCSCSSSASTCAATHPDSSPTRRSVADDKTHSLQRRKPPIKFPVHPTVMRTSSRGHEGKLERWKDRYPGLHPAPPPYATGASGRNDSQYAVRSSGEQCSSSAVRDDHQGGTHSRNCTFPTLFPSAQWLVAPSLMHCYLCDQTSSPQRPNQFGVTSRV